MNGGNLQYERERLLSLRSYSVLDTEPEASFDGLVKAASVIAGTPIALVSLVDAERQWFKAKVGVDATETPREHAFCSHAIERPAPVYIVEDALSDVRFGTNPLVTNDPHIRFYAGFPLRDEAGYGLGTLCVIDRVPRQLTATQLDALAGLARSAEVLLETRRIASDLSVSRRLAMIFRRGFESANVGMQLVGVDGHYLQVNEAFAQIVGRSADDLVGMHWREVTHPDDCQDEAEIDDLLETGAIDHHEELVRYVRPDGSLRWGQLNVVPVISESGTGRIHFAQVTDVTNTVEARLRAEALAVELSASELRMSALMDPAPDPTYRFDSDLRLAAANPAGLQLIDLTDEQAVGRRVGELGFEVQLAAAIDVTIGRALESHAVQRTDRVAFSAPGEALLWFDVRVAPVGSDDGADTLVVLRDITETVENELRLTAMALVDPLTGLSNRAALCDRVHHALARLDPAENVGVAAVMVDLDHFKTINDSFGHRVGDESLVRVAQVLQSAVRDQDTVGRLGGDEFLIVLEDLGDVDGARAAATRIHRALMDTTVDTPDGPVRVAGSIGVAWTTTRMGPEDFVAEADRALYEAKRRGRGQIWVGGTDEFAPFGSNAALMRDLGHALARRQFEIHFQPIVDRDGCTVAEEALLRWGHPEHGLLLPVSFINRLLETGLMGPVGQWMLHWVIGHLAEQISAGNAPPNGVHVNLSPAEVGNPHLPELLTGLLSASGVPAELLTIELTEQALARTSLSSSALRRLGQIGVRLALDDFGTGASALTHLRHGGLSAVKLDRTFVQGIVTDPRDQAIVRATMQMARDLGLDVIAEGVETVGQRDWLLANGCTHLQGWYYGAARRPGALVNS
jgi:diguanylate cyclase (GGDEF)-like protein/PAS domain S-box-containing protein